MAPPPRSPTARRRLVLRLAGTAIALLVVARLVMHADLSRSFAQVWAIGPWLALALVPFVVGMSVDTVAWRRILAALGERVSHLSLLRIRLATEAFVLTVPGGVVLAEVWKPIFLNRHLAVPGARATASVTAKKALYITADAAYLGLGLVGGFGLLVSLGQELGLPQGLHLAPAIAVAAAVLALGLAGVAFCSALDRGTVATKLFAWLRRVPSRRVQARLGGLEKSFVTVDESARAFFAGGPRQVAPVFSLLFLQWLLEASETYVMLRLLGIEAGFLAVLAFESLVSLLKSLAFFLPAGLGLQEVGQVFFMKAVGVGDAVTVGASLLMMKRSKDLFWGFTGYALMARLGAAKAGVRA